MTKIDLDALLLGVLLGNLIGGIAGYILNIASIEVTIVMQGAMVLFGFWWYFQKLDNKEDKR